MRANDPRSAAILADLNDPQRQAVTHRDGPLLVLAGPGSGKTRVITRRAAWLVHSGVPARNILAITFTNKAADEMRRRIAELGVDRGMWVYTFHALGARLLREFGPLGRVRPGFTIYDEDDQLRLVKEAMELAGIGETLMRPADVQARISRAKNALRLPAQMLAGANYFDERTVARVYEGYEQLLEERNAVDFDDLLLRVALVLGAHPEISERLNVRFRYVLVDEYQDTNHAQYLIARHLSQHHRNLCVTGDPDQSIYGWRGADLGNILEFERDYADAVVVRLEQNYRSHGHILRIADRLISANRRRKHKTLWTQRGAGEPVRIWRFDDGAAEAGHVAATIAEARANGQAYSDFAIIYRVNALSRGLEEALRNHGIPYKIARGVEFYNRREIRDTLAYLRVLVNPADQIALLRIINTPARGIGKTSINRLLQSALERRSPLMQVLREADRVLAGAAARKVRAFVELIDSLLPLANGPVADAVSRVLTLTGLEAALRKEREEGGEDRLANVQELVTAAARYEEETAEPTLEEFLTRVSLASDQDAVDEAAGVVMLMTLHAAKGLEFPRVFIVGLEQGLLPHERSLRGEGDLEEERRLLFVGITRAQERLCLSHARERVIRGIKAPRAASQFLPELLDAEACLEEDFVSAAPPTGDEHYDDSHEEAQGDLDELHPRQRLGRSSRRLRGLSAEEEDGLPVIHVAGREATSEIHSPYADWKPGMLVKHERFGVGQIVWIRPSAAQTRASIRFVAQGEKTLVLEFAPVKLLQR